MAAPVAPGGQPKAPEKIALAWAAAAPMAQAIEEIVTGEVARLKTGWAILLRCHREAGVGIMPWRMDRVTASGGETAEQIADAHQLTTGVEDVLAAMKRACSARGQAEALEWLEAALRRLGDEILRTEARR